MTTATAEAPVYGISMKEAAKLLGVSVPTVWRRAVAGELAAYRIGRRILIDPVELRAKVRSAINQETL